MSELYEGKCLNVSLSGMTLHTRSALESWSVPAYPCLRLARAVVARATASIAIASLTSLFLKSCSDQVSSKRAPFCAYPGAAQEVRLPLFGLDL